MTHPAAPKPRLWQKGAKPARRQLEPLQVSVPGLLEVFTSASLGTFFFQNCAKKGSAGVPPEPGERLG